MFCHRNAVGTVMDFTIAHERVTAVVDENPRRLIVVNLAILDETATVITDKDAALPVIMDMTATDVWCCPAVNEDAGQQVAKNIAIFQRAAGIRAEVDTTSFSMV